MPGSPSSAEPLAARPQLGIGANLPQFCLLIGVNALVGGMVGQERAILPLTAQRVFGVGAFTTMLTFLVAFGVVKAVADVAAGALADRVGRKPVLLAGWLAGAPVPLLLMWAPSWGWVVVANVFLGLNQGLAWSATVIMKVDLAGPKRRGLAMGLNEAAGYGAVAAAAAATGWIAEHAGLRPEPFFLGLAFAGVGLGISAVFVRETRPFAIAESDGGSGMAFGAVFASTSWGDRTLAACCQAGLVNNLNDGVAWGVLPLWFAGAGLSVGRIGVLAALYPAVWGVLQLLTGALSDRIGRKGLIVGGMLLQAVAIAQIAGTQGFAAWAFGVSALGAGTAMVYPTLLAAIGDVAPAARRASALGVYRLWRDLGFAAGAIAAGLIADAWGLAPAIWAAAALTGASGIVAWHLMRETLPTPVTTATRAG